MRMLVNLVVTLSFLQVALSKFKVTELNVDDSRFQDLGYCDERADRAANRLVANALRRYMTLNHVKITVDKGDVRTSQTYPEESIPTGNCDQAWARDIVASAFMLPGKVELGPEGVTYDDELQNSIAVGTAGHALSVDLNIKYRVRANSYVFGCIFLSKETCPTDAYSEGTNKFFNLAASNGLTECIGGQEHLVFNLDVNVYHEADEDSYGPVEVGRRSDCDLTVLWGGVKVGSINNIIQKMAKRYIKSGSRFNEVRGPKLVAELEKKLGEELGSIVAIPLNHADGSPRLCADSQPAPKAGKRQYKGSRCGLKRKSCPAEFVRIGNTDKCQKFFGPQRPSCEKFGAGAELHTEKLGRSRELHWCHTPMV